MTPIRRFLVWILERLLGTYYEGPEPPARAGGLVLEFCRVYPKATRQQWIDFAAQHARLMYREGYVRGYEWTERDLVRRDPGVEPEEAMRTLDPSGAWLERPFGPDEYLTVDDPPRDDDEEVDVAAEVAAEQERQREYAARRAAGPVVR